MSFEEVNYYDCNKKDKIRLEPRLSEYINKMKYFRQNSIETENLEREYGITDNDKIIIKRYLAGKNSKDLRFQDYVDTSKSYFPSEKMQYDTRFDRIKKKQERIADANAQRYNYGSIENTYDMYRNDRPFASACGDDFSQDGFHPREWFNRNTRDMDVSEYNKYATKPEKKHTNIYTQPKSRYNGRIPYGSKIDDENTIDEILNSMDSTKKNYSRIIERESEFDYDSGNVIPNMRSKNMLCGSSYKTMPYMGDMRGNMDIDVDNFVKFGNSTRGSKSIGYPNPVDHYFDFISPDIQDPRHVVMDRGIPSRAWNRERGSRIKRETM